MTAFARFLTGLLVVTGAAQANTQFNMPAERLAEEAQVGVTTCTAELFFDGVSQGRLAANLVSLGGGPLMVKLVFSYDDLYESVINQGVEVVLGRLDVEVCGQVYHHYHGADPADWESRRWPYNLGLPPFSLPASMVLGNAPQFLPCTSLPQDPPGAEALPRVFNLGLPAPNPFNPTTVLQLGLPVGQELSLEVRNAAGQPVRSLLQEWRPAGLHQVVFDGTGLASGVYFCTLSGVSGRVTRKVLLLK